MGAGPAREREQSSRQDSRDLYCSGGRSFVSETRCNGGAFRDRSSRPWPLLVWPSLAKQLPPGTTIAPLTWQRHRHGSEHRLDLSTKCGLWRRISQGAPGSGGPVQDTPRVHPCRLGVWPSLAKHGPGRAHPIPVRPLWREKFLESCRVADSHPFAGGARSHRPAPTSAIPVRAFWRGRTQLGRLVIGNSQRSAMRHSPHLGLRATQV